MLGLICAGALAGCFSDRRFQTHAVYAGPAGHFEVVIDARGLIAAGSDVSKESSAEVEVKPVGGGPGTPVHVMMALPVPPGGRRLSNLVELAGFKAPAAELAELDRVVDRVLLGPKSTLVRGQTVALRVVEMTLVYR